MFVGFKPNNQADKINPPEWTLEEDEGHGFYDAQRRKELYEKLEIFLAKHIGK